MSKKRLGIDVLTAARQRISYVFDHFPRIYVSFSGGKDSTVMLHLVMEEAARQKRRIGVLFVDLEGQYALTVEHITAMRNTYNDHEWFWVCLPLVLRNAVSVYEPRWQCWDPDKQDVWIRPLPTGPGVITDSAYFPFFRRGMEFEEFVPEFGKWYAMRGLDQSGPGVAYEDTACFIGIRSDESFNRHLKVKVRAHREFFRGRMWLLRQKATHMGIYSAHPIYDWRTEDIWTYHAKEYQPYNKIYDLMHKAGVSIHQQRICQPYGEDQRRGLWMYHVIEPGTWAKLLARVNGANSGAGFVQLSGNVSGQIKITKPEGHTWESFAMLILGSMPERMADHYKDKIAVFLKWYQERGYPDGIPDEADRGSEVAKTKPSWRRICKMLLRNDYFAKGLSFDQTKPEYYIKYKKVMANRRRRWGIFPS